MFFSRWHACKSSGVTSCPVRVMALHTVSFRTLSPTSRGTGLTSRASLLIYWALLTAFRSNSIIDWCRRVFTILCYYQTLNQTLTPHVWQRKYQICHLKFLIDSWCQISEVAPQSIIFKSILFSNQFFCQILNLASCQHHINTNKLLIIKII